MAVSLTFPKEQPIWTNYKEEQSQGAATFETAYQIARYIRKMFSDTPGCIFSDKDLQGPPNDYWIQTKIGLVIEEEWGIPKIIHTPIGAWTILHNASGDFNAAFEDIKKDLLLQRINGPCANAGSMVGGPQLWAVMQWEGQKLEWPEYRSRRPSRHDFLPGGVINGIWKECCERHRDVRDYG